jgi:hypothetical protein
MWLSELTICQNVSAVYLMLLEGTTMRKHKVWFYPKCHVFIKAILATDQTRAPEVLKSEEITMLKRQQGLKSVRNRNGNKTELIGIFTVIRFGLIYRIRRPTSVDILLLQYTS